MITITDLSKSYGSQQLFKDVNLRINDQEKIGLIGRNGSGKSTFIKMLLNREDDQNGAIQIPDTVIMSTLEQHLNFEHETLLKQVCASLPFHSQHNDWQAKSLLMGLGFSELDFEKKPTEFSSGFQIRIRLAEALIKEPHLLLLDEPTNYLDILSLRWLERFLQQWKSSFILVTHDREFMEKVVTHTISIHRGEMKKLKGGPRKMMDQIKKEEDIYEKTRVNQEKKRKKTEEFIRTFRAGARSAGLVQSRIKSLEKQEVKEKLSSIPQITFQFNSIPFQGDSPMKVHNIRFEYDDVPIFKDFSITINKGDRIAIMGRNGKGKSTLLKVLAGKLKPSSGSVRPHVNSVQSFYSTEQFKTLIPQRSILEELRTMPNIKEQQMRNLCGSLLFIGDASHKKIKQLSGGEKNRVCLGKSMLKSSNLLFLDEPTNHLDMESCQSLFDAVESYLGAVVFVSHDEEMVSRLANRLVIFDAGSVEVFDRGYVEFLERRGWSEEESEQFFKAAKRTSQNKNDYEQRKENKKLLRKIRSQQEELNKKVDTLNKKHEKTAHELADAYQEKDQAQMQKLGQLLKSLEQQVDDAYQQLEQLMDQESQLSSALES